MINFVSLWKQTHGAVCSITHLSGGDSIGQGTGFLVDRWIVTNNHVMQGGAATHVKLQFVRHDGHTVASAKVFTAEAFRSLLVDGEPESSWDYAILRGEHEEFKGQPRLHLASTPAPSIGTSIGLLGFQFEDRNLSINAGLLSSKYARANVDYLQLDASVNHGNSGGPLLDAATGRVIGIVTRKATGLTKQFDDLLASFDHNVAALAQAKAIMSIGGIDPIEGFRISQTQLKGISVELRRSANVGIGYAYDISKVRSALSMLGYVAP